MPHKHRSANCKSNTNHENTFFHSQKNKSMKTRLSSYNRDSTHGNDYDSDYSSLGGASSDSDYIVARKKSVNKFDKEASENSDADSNNSHTSNDSDYNHSGTDSYYGGDSDDNTYDDSESRQEIHFTNDKEAGTDSEAEAVPYSKNGGDMDENSDDDDFSYEDSEARQSFDSLDGSDYSGSELAYNIDKREYASRKYNGKCSNAVITS
jgi:hypothetical protein